MWYKSNFIILAVLIAFSIIPAAHALSIEKKIANGSDDAYEVNGKMVVNGTIVVAGKEWGSVFRGGYRFTKINIPNGAKITNATLSLAYNWRSGPSPKTILYGESTNNAASFGIKNYNISNRSRTAANVRWTNISSGAWGSYFTSPDISKIIQEIVNRSGWSSGNSIGILFYEDPQTTDEWESISYEGGYPSYLATLRINYTPPKVIIFRDDDAQIWWRVNTFKNITNTLKNNKIPQTIGVIPYAGGSTIGDDVDFKNYLNSIKNYSTVELALHGYQHTDNEFANLSLQQAEQKISSGMTIFKSDLGIGPKTFIPPNHAYNNATLQASKNKGFTRFSADTDVDPYSWKEYPAGLLHVSAVTEFYDWDANRQRTASEITTDCQNALNKYNTCVILLHYWQFTDSDSRLINSTTYQTLLNVIKWVHTKESGGVKLRTIKQYSK